MSDVKPRAWWDDAGTFISDAVKQTSRPAFAALYSNPLYDQAAIDAAVAAERERLANAWCAAHGYDRMGVADWVRRV